MGGMGFIELNKALRRLRRALRVPSVESSVPEGGGKTSVPPAPAAMAVHPASPVAASTPATSNDALRTLPHLLSKRFRELEPLRVFNVPGDAPRVSLVTDSISASSLFSGVGTAVVIAALLARHLGARLRVITLTEPPEPGNVGAVLATNRIHWGGDIEFVHVGPGRKEEVPVGDHELFLTTSWWSTSRVLPIVHPQRLVCLLQEDERMFHAWGDDRLRCVETLSDPNIRFVVNRQLLFDHLTQGPDALPNILANGVWFEPVFPAFDRELAEVESRRRRTALLLPGAAEQPAQPLLAWIGGHRRGARGKCSRPFRVDVSPGRRRRSASRAAANRAAARRAASHRSESAVAGLCQAGPPHGCRLVPHGRPVPRPILRSISRPRVP